MKQTHYSHNDPEMQAQEIYDPKLGRWVSKKYLQRKKWSNIVFVAFAIILIALCLAGCKKDPVNPEPQCWTCNDLNANMIQIICAPSEQAAFDQSGLINGVHTLDNFKKYCKK